MREMFKNLLVVITLFIFIEGGAGLIYYHPKSVYAQEQDDVSESFKKAYPGVAVEKVNKTDMEGIYEVIFEGGAGLMYYHPKTGNVIFGEIWSKSGKSITGERLESLLVSQVKNIPLDKAIKIGNGKNEIIEISDVDCPFCRKASDWLDKRNDVTRYVFLFPLTQIHPEAEAKSKHILCAKEPSKEYLTAMKGGLDNRKDLTPCDTFNDVFIAHKDVGLKMRVTGTPLFIVNGKLVKGADFKKIEANLKK